MQPEDKRAAVGLSVSLSSQLLAAALALLAIEGAYVAYALAERRASWLFLPAAATAAVAFAVSCFIAGKAITKDRDVGFAGNWDITAAKSLYNAQAAFLLLGILAFALALGVSGPRVELGGGADLLGPELERLEDRLDNLTQALTEVRDSVGGLREAISEHVVVPDSAHVR